MKAQLETGRLRTASPVRRCAYSSGHRLGQAAEDPTSSPGDVVVVVGDGVVPEPVESSRRCRTWPPCPSRCRSRRSGRAGSRSCPRSAMTSAAWPRRGRQRRGLRHRALRSGGAGAAGAGRGALAEKAARSPRGVFHRGDDRAGTGSRNVPVGGMSISFCLPPPPPEPPDPPEPPSRRFHRSRGHRSRRCHRSRRPAWRLPAATESRCRRARAVGAARSRRTGLSPPPMLIRASPAAEGPRATSPGRPPGWGPTLAIAVSRSVSTGVGLMEPVGRHQPSWSPGSGSRRSVWTRLSKSPLSEGHQESGR